MTEILIIGVAVLSAIGTTKKVYKMTFNKLEERRSTSSKKVYR